MALTAKKWRIIDLINWGNDHFTNKGIDNARREMEWFLCEILNCKRIDLYIRFEEIIHKTELDLFRKMVKRRISGEPFQYIIGKGTFYGRDFIVNESVLIPRPETEILIQCLKLNGKVKSLLDIGTGSGCIAITVLLENLASSVYATDNSVFAINTTKENIKLYNTDKIQIQKHDFLNEKFKKKFDVIISNPPYINKYETNSLQSEVKNFEPLNALTDNSTGLSFYHHFANEFDNLLTNDGYLLLEFGGNSQKQSIETIFKSAGLKTKFYKDLQNDYRVVEVHR